MSNLQSRYAVVILLQPMASADDAYRIGPRFIVACFSSVISNFWCTFDGVPTFCRL